MGNDCSGMLPSSDSTLAQVCLFRKPTVRFCQVRGFTAAHRIFILMQPTFDVVVDIFQPPESDLCHQMTAYKALVSWNFNILPRTTDRLAMPLIVVQLRNRESYILRFCQFFCGTRKIPSNNVPAVPYPSFPLHICLLAGCIMLYLHHRSAPIVEKSSLSPISNALISTLTEYLPCSLSQSLCQLISRYPSFPKPTGLFTPPL